MGNRSVPVESSAAWRELKGARPMATIVLVHGNDNQRESADLIESSWLRPGGGVRLAARGDLADRLWPPRSRPDLIDCRAAYYGDLFRSPDRQGDGDDLRDLSADQAALAEALALEWLERVALSRRDRRGRKAPSRVFRASG